MQRIDDHTPTQPGGDTPVVVPCAPRRRSEQRFLSAAPVRERRGNRLTRARAAARALASEVGQGTVEYVGLLLLMATLLAAIVGAASQLGGRDQIGKKVVNQIGQSIDRAGQGAER